MRISWVDKISNEEVLNSIRDRKHLCDELLYNLVEGRMVGKPIR